MFHQQPTQAGDLVRSTHKMDPIPSTQTTSITTFRHRTWYLIYRFSSPHTRIVDRNDREICRLDTILI